MKTKILFKNRVSYYIRKVGETSQKKLPLAVFPTGTFPEIPPVDASIQGRAGGSLSGPALLSPTLYGATRAHQHFCYPALAQAHNHCVHVSVGGDK